ncbi:MAG: cupredoxin family protein [Sterolibacterium sp.]
MKLKLNPVMATLAAVLILTSGIASASGKHAGDHDDAAIGEPGVASEATRTVAVDMTDTMRFSPARITAKQGETIRFVVKNSGQIKHEFVLGSAKELKEHYEVMKKNPEMEHADANMVTLAAGQTGEVVWKFTKPGKVDFACLQPGHYDAGMKGRVIVKKKALPKDDHDHKH